MTAYTDDWWDGYDQACADLVKVLPTHFSGGHRHEIESIVEHIKERPDFRRTLHRSAEKRRSREGT